EAEGEGDPQRAEDRYRLGIESKVHPAVRSFSHDDDRRSDARGQQIIVEEAELNCGRTDEGSCIRGEITVTLPVKHTDSDADAHVFRILPGVSHGIARLDVVPRATKLGHTVEA